MSNPVERLVRRIDAVQRRHTVPAFVFGVVKKFGDDNGGALVSNLTYAAFVSIFPLLLVLVTLLGLVASGDPSLRQHVLHAVAAQFPLVGNQLAGNVHALRRSSAIGLVVGLAVVVWGTTSLAQAGLFTMAQVWNLPGPARPGYAQRLARASLFIATLGLGIGLTTALAAFSALSGQSVVARLAGAALAIALNIGLYFLAFRILTPKGVPSSLLAPGAITGGVGWTLLQALGTYLVGRYLRNDSVYGVFASVLGLLAWIYVSVEWSVYAAEINVVLTRRLWPRSIVQPPLTEADRASAALQALQNQRRSEQRVRVDFDGDTARPDGGAAAPKTPEEVTPPGEPADDGPVRSSP